MSPPWIWSLNCFLEISPDNPTTSWKLTLHFSPDWLLPPSSSPQSMTPPALSQARNGGVLLYPLSSPGHPQLLSLYLLCFGLSTSPIPTITTAVQATTFFTWMDHTKGFLIVFHFLSCPSLVHSQFSSQSVFLKQCQVEQCHPHSLSIPALNPLMASHYLWNKRQNLPVAYKACTLGPRLNPPTSPYTPTASFTVFQPFQRSFTP